jgi:hypothetical protein
LAFPIVFLAGDFFGAFTLLGVGMGDLFARRALISIALFIALLLLTGLFLDGFLQVTHFEDVWVFS